MPKKRSKKLIVTISGVPEGWASKENLEKLERNDGFAIYPDGTMEIPLDDAALAKNILREYCGFFKENPKEPK